MPRLITVSLACALFSIVGCGKKAPEATPQTTGQSAAAAAKPAKVLPRPDNGAPVGVEFVEWTGEPARRGVELLVYNHAAVTVVGYTFVLRYYDADDELLLVKEGTSLENDNDFGTVVGDAFHCEPERNLRISLDPKILAVPEAATRLEVVASKVYQVDPDSELIVSLWAQENFTEWPGDPLPTPSMEAGEDEPSML